MARRVEKYREMNSNELEIQQRELAEQIFRLRFQLSTGQLKDTARLQRARREVARLATLLNERMAGTPAEGRQA
jgi:large subunit ribosomal protein L29